MQYVKMDDIPVPVSRVVLGTDWFGSRHVLQVAHRRVTIPVVDRRREAQIFELLDGAHDAGCTAFDTARSYGDSERTLGTWLQSRRIRDQVVVISKGGHPGRDWKPRLSPNDISADLEGSLKALQTEYIDVYLLHYDDHTVEIAPMLDVLNRHVRSGHIRHIGVSNWSTRRIAEAEHSAKAAGQSAFSVSSVQLSLASWRSPPWKNARSISGDEAEDERRWYQEREMWVLAYSSLAMGFFSSARASKAGPQNGPRQGTLAEQTFDDARNAQRLERAKDLARQLAVSPGQIALAWVLQEHPRVLAIVGARKASAFVDAAHACTIQLSQAQRMWLSHGTPGDQTGVARS